MIQLVLLIIKTAKPFWQILEFKCWLSHMLKNWYAILIWLPANRVSKNNVNLFSFFVFISKFEYELLVNQVSSQKTVVLFAGLNNVVNYCRTNYTVGRAFRRAVPCLGRVITNNNFLFESNASWDVVFRIKALQSDFLYIC